MSLKKELLSEIILEFHRSDLPTLIPRAPIEIPTLPSNVRKAFVFMGIRRCGKTYLMYLDMQKKIKRGLAKEKILYINFEDDRLTQFELADFQTILDVYFQLYPQCAEASDLCFYFDEIQNILGWEKFIRRLLDKEKMSLFITGSSAKLLSIEIATSLRGRCIEQEVFPLSFKEYLSYRGITISTTLTSKEKAAIRHHAEHYLWRGGFPETLDLSDPLHTQTIQSYVNACVFRDVIERHELKVPHIVKLFLIHCLQNIASPLSITKVYNTLRSRGEELTRSHLYKYLGYFEDAYLICSVPIFDFSTRKRQVNPSKIYVIDTGIILSYSIKKEMEKSTCLENAVYLHLRRSGPEQIFYYKTKTGKEVDFIAQFPNGRIDLIQASLDLHNEATRQREISALIEAAAELDKKEAFLITLDHEEIVTIGELTIYIKPYWQWSAVQPVF
jgi:predicted AAA+ superfamily ATPase